MPRPRCGMGQFPYACKSAYLQSPELRPRPFWEYLSLSRASVFQAQIRQLPSRRHLRKLSSRSKGDTSPAPKLPAPPANCSRKTKPKLRSRRPPRAPGSKPAAGTKKQSDPPRPPPNVSTKTDPKPPAPPPAASARIKASGSHKNAVQRRPTLSVLISFALGKLISLVAISNSSRFKVQSSRSKRKL